MTSVRWLRTPGTAPAVLLMANPVCASPGHVHEFDVRRAVDFDVEAELGRDEGALEMSPRSLEDLELHAVLRRGAREEAKP